MDPITLKALELAKESSDRARAVLLIMQVTCIVVFMAAWREAPFGWTFVRLRTAQAAVWYVDCLETQHPEDPGFAQQTNSRHDSCHITGDPQPFRPTEIDAAKKYLADWKFTPAEARRQLENLQDTLVKQTMNVTVPFLGFTFDVNDLSVLGGMSFLLILVWLYFSLRREELNIALLFRSRNGQALGEVYTLASMTQVLTVTPKAGSPENNFKVKALAWVLRFLSFSPLAVQLFVLWFDWETLGKVGPQSPHFVIVQFKVGVALFVAMAFVTWRCMRRSRDVDKHWRDANSRRQAPEETTQSDNSGPFPTHADC